MSRKGENMNGNVIAQIRGEGNNRKECFTTFSLQVAAISIAFLGLIGRELGRNNYIGFGCIGIIILTLLVVRLGNYKYASANRNFSYQLHLKRCRDYIYLRENELSQLDWEEAMFAWRIVQASVYEAIYAKSYGGVLGRYDKTNAKYKWWDSKAVSCVGAKYHPGSYLKHMQGAMYLITALAWILLLAFTVSAFPTVTGSPVLFILYLIALLGSGAYGICRFICYKRQRVIVESGLLSIQSCAVMWRAIAIAHLQARERTFSGNNSYKGFTQNLGLIANYIASNLERIHDWMDREANWEEYERNCTLPII